MILMVTMPPQIRLLGIPGTTSAVTGHNHTTTINCANIMLLLIILLIIWPITVVIGLEPIGIPSWWVPSGSGTQSIDLLGALTLHNTSHPGVSQVPGPNSLRPAYKLQGDHRDLRLPQTVFEKAANLIRQNAEFTIAASLLQEEDNSGTIISFSRGSNRYLEVQSSGRRDEIRLHYYLHQDSIVHVETFPFRLADNTWHNLAVSISGSQVELLVDCHPLYKRLLRPGAPDRNLSLPQLQLWIGQRNKNHSFFKGTLQEVTLITGPHGYLRQCPQLDSTCPTCGQFSLLQNTVKELSKRLLEVSQRLEAAEGRITKVEECDCLKSCPVNGSVHADGASWQRDCDICACVHGEVQCRPVQCPKPNCKKPFKNPGECCWTCLKQCFMRGVMYDHGDQIALRECLECECHDGSMHCSKVDPKIKCPPLKCPPSEQFSVAGECCKFCPGVDYCAKGHTCHANATCRNLQTTYACQCDRGFQGDGHMCNDVDECLQEGDYNGHHCHLNTKCVNTPGSYTCECLPGYRRLDKFNCIELDECSTGKHSCDIHATCINTLGSYHCQCNEGYTGDGFKCEPVCRQSCLNGGKCIGPDQCSCREGYIGPSCELDLDECQTGVHQCHDTSVCVNMPGWYYCKCKPGYRTIFHHNTLGTLCQDIDECKEGTHTCHPSAQCVNTQGSFMCTCPNPDDLNCRQSCMYQGKEILNGMETIPDGQPCKRCTCDHGVISCHDPACDCSIKGSAHDKCCPQCDPNQTCRHQELQQVLFKSGERWTYQCQTCECWLGEIDCWQLECPPLTCLDRIRTPGDCCEQCNDDPCTLDTYQNASNGGMPCTYAGRLYDSGSQWKDPDDRCTACNCKDGRICCSFDNRCGSESGRAVANNSVAHNGATSNDERHAAQRQQQQLQTQQSQSQQFGGALPSSTTFTTPKDIYNVATSRVAPSAPTIVATTTNDGTSTDTIHQSDRHKISNSLRSFNNTSDNTKRYRDSNNNVSVASQVSSNVSVSNSFNDSTTTVLSNNITDAIYVSNSKKNYSEEVNYTKTETNWGPEEG